MSLMRCAVGKHFHWLASRNFHFGNQLANQIMRVLLELIPIGLPVEIPFFGI